MEPYKLRVSARLCLTLAPSRRGPPASTATPPRHRHSPTPLSFHFLLISILLPGSNNLAVVDALDACRRRAGGRGVVGRAGGGRGRGRRRRGVQVVLALGRGRPLGRGVVLRRLRRRVVPVVGVCGTKSMSATRGPEAIRITIPPLTSRRGLTLALPPLGRVVLLPLRLCLRLAGLVSTSLVVRLLGVVGLAAGLSALALVGLRAGLDRVRLLERARAAAAHHPPDEEHSERDGERDWQRLSVRGGESARSGGGTARKRAKGGAWGVAGPTSDTDA